MRIHVTCKRRQTARIVPLIAASLMVAACSGEANKTGHSVDSGSRSTVATVRPLPPAALTAKGAPLHVTLHWSAPAGGATVDRYDIYRDGSYFGGVLADTTRFVDHDVLPGTRYRYEIEAHGERGSSDRVSTVVRTMVPQLGAARIDGVFDVHATTLSQSGYVSFDISSYGWRLKPRCKTGACSVVWSDLRDHAIHATLSRHGARYIGRYTGYFFGKCSGARETTAVEIEFRVVAARVVDGQWLATRLVGTLSQSETAQLGCVSAQARQSIRAKREAL
jgi:hypothetical protein